MDDAKFVRKSISGARATIALAAFLCLSKYGMADVRAYKEICAYVMPTETIKFTGLYPAIENPLPLSSFEPGQIVEIDPLKMPAEEAREYVKGLKAVGARVSIYLVGGHCYRGADCDELPDSAQLGSTGSWNWNKTERRILNVTHPAVLARLAKGIQRGWELGANYIRIDNLHHPAGSINPRTPAQMGAIIELAHDIEDRLRNNGTIETDRVTGLVAHNNLTVWQLLIEQGKLRRLPAFLTSERTAQLAAVPNFEGDALMKIGRLSHQQVPDIQAGRRIADYFQIPYSIVEFQVTHDLARPNQFYETPQTYFDAVQRLTGVTEVLVVPNESRYVGRDMVYRGRGPRTLPQHPELANRTGKACPLPPI